MSEPTVVPFFDQIGITNVVWLDDLFDARIVPREVDIAERVAIAPAAGTPPSHAKLLDLTAEDSPQEWANQIKQRLDDSEQVDLFSEIAQPSQGGAAQAQSDYSPTEVEAVVSSLCATMKRVGFSEWSSIKEELIASGASGVFLVDRGALRRRHPE
jgi:hypothetical protein